MPKSKKKNVKHQRKELTEIQRGKILGLHDAGLGYKKIGKQLKIPKSTVQSTVKKFSGRKNLQSRRRRGAPAKIEEKTLKNIDDYIKGHRDSTPKEIVQELKLPVKERQVYNIRKKLGFVPDKGKKVLELSDENMKERVEWCRKRKNDNLDDLIVGDEKAFTIGKARRLQYRKPDEPRVKQVSRKYPEKFSVYAAIGRHGKTAISVWKGRQDSEKYCSNLKETLLPLIRNKYPNSHYYCHDKEPTHRSKQTKNWLKEKKITYSYFPTNSPDLNPIEYLWWCLDSRVAKHHPQTFEDYKQWVVYEWDRISIEEINRTFDHIVKLIPNVIESKGAQVEKVRAL